MTRRWRELRAAIDRVTHLVDQVDRRSEKMETILMVREPSSGAAADAYDGLRKQVVAAVTERMAHLAQLAQLDAALTAGASADSAAKLVRSWLEQASLERVSDPGHPNRDLLYQVVEDLGGAYEVLEPAYVDVVTGRVIRRGSVRRHAVAAAVPQYPDGGQQPSGEPGAPWEVSQ